MDHHRHGPHRNDHGRARLEHHQRGAAGHVRDDGRHDRGDHVGGDGLHSRPGDRDADHRTALDAIRPEELLHGERGPVHRRIDGVWSGARTWPDGALSRAPGIRRWRSSHGPAGHPARDLSAGRAGNCHGTLRARRRAGAGVRAHARRVAHRSVFLAVDLLHQRAGRRAERGHGLAVHRGSPVSRAREGLHRLARARTAHCRPWRAATDARGGCAERLVRVAVHRAPCPRRRHWPRGVRVARAHHR